MSTVEEHIQTTARNLAAFLQSEEVDEGLKQAVDAILFDAANEANLSATDAEIIEAVFPIILKRLDKSYAKGIFHSIKSILDLHDESAYLERLTDDPVMDADLIG